MAATTVWPLAFSASMILLAGRASTTLLLARLTTPVRPGTMSTPTTLAVLPAMVAFQALTPFPAAEAGAASRDTLSTAAKSRLAMRVLRPFM